MKRINAFICSIYDFLETKWIGPSGHRLVSTLVIFCFIGSLCLVEVKKLDMLPHYVSVFIPDSFLASIEVAFTLLLILEVMGLVFSIVDSVSASVGRQLEILSLILLRDVFKEISHIKEPVVWEQLADKVAPVVATSLGAVIIFSVLWIFYRLMKRVELKVDEADKRSFIFSKKIIALGLLVAFHGIIISSIIGKLTGYETADIFESFYTLLIFTDILIVLISMRYGHDYHVAFRNSGFAVVTVFIRIALIAPAVYSAGIGVIAALFALAVMAVYNISVRKGPEPSEP